jgi:hypothetical protein
MRVAHSKRNDGPLVKKGTLVLGTVALALVAATDWAGDAPESARALQTIASLQINGGPQSGRAVSTTRQKTRAGSGSAAYRTFQVPAGTRLPIELRTALASDRSQPQDYVRGRLREAIVQDGVELVPTSAPVLGTIISATPVSKPKDRGHLSFRFHVIEHPETGSRVSIRTESIELDGTVADPKHPKKGEAEVRLAPGDDVSASTLEPFLVFIPKR